MKLMPQTVRAMTGLLTRARGPHGPFELGRPDPKRPPYWTLVSGRRMPRGGPQLGPALRIRLLFACKRNPGEQTLPEPLPRSGPEACTSRGCETSARPRAARTRWRPAEADVALALTCGAGEEGAAVVGLGDVAPEPAPLLHLGELVGQEEHLVVAPSLCLKT